MVSLRRKPIEPLPSGELAIMQVLWERGPSIVQEVQDALGNTTAYTTVQTTLNTMTRKGHTKRTLQGKAYVYSAKLKRQAVAGDAVEHLVDRMFGGQVEGLLLNLVENEKVSDDTLTRLKRAIAEREKKGR